MIPRGAESVNGGVAVGRGSTVEDIECKRLTNVGNGSNANDVLSVIGPINLACL